MIEEKIREKCPLGHRKVYMNKEDAYKLYNNIKDINLSELLDIIVDTKDEEERNFYVKIYNYVMQSRQKVLVANGVY